ncbi:branched-chain amino acid ABC transporter permease [Verminephrobacter eiseniae]|uniref:branched-chain amino acid ABC transporter permease n=1 Tax=Verminephrobacter eiseniae TaxID=364317 RepID=UPI0010E20780|nr:branched-chain amino acid ABC transporter permease [Verminephrobacter eiseniae]KAB7585060.1 branched-chain amino acid ABC transporter permease [Verminephrobacter sp. Larva24]MCW5233118.1 branched-chain amino acid ABC transporter permease [Verminephrobacter eiseniae]MCW5295327.1 branched-chain amino acid ABC transporter permease [Verminephrobacter eiseniae]MCW8183599.1 branched-chain amino acid ABC transporter permease [Verminephrobacter eiseniae]MCW8223396.1 branched-chain amino acid ABC tr
MMQALLQALVSGLASGGAYALVALGLGITFTTTKTLNFAHGDFVSAGSFIGLSVMLLLTGAPLGTGMDALAVDGMAQLVALALAVLAMGLLGSVLYLTAVRPFAGKPGMAWVMSTIGFGIIVQSIGLAMWGPAPFKVPAPFGEEVIRIAGVGLRSQEILIIVTALAVMALLDFVLQRTMIGKALRAVAHDRRVASLMGIDVAAIMLGAFFVSTGLAGLCGYLLAPIASASLFMGLGIALKGFCGAILGGLTNPRGCVLGGFVLGLLESLINLWQAQWREIVLFALVILVLALRPNGLFGRAVTEKV